MIYNFLNKNQNKVLQKQSFILVKSIINDDQSKYIKTLNKSNKTYRDCSLSLNQRESSSIQFGSIFVLFIIFNGLNYLNIFL